MLAGTPLGILWAANFAVTVTFLPLLKGAGLSSAYGLYGAAAALSFLFVLFAVRETKGKTLEEMSSRYNVNRQAKEYQQCNSE